MILVSKSRSRTDHVWSYLKADLEPEAMMSRRLVGAGTNTGDCAYENISDRHQHEAHNMMLMVSEIEGVLNIDTARKSSTANMRQNM